MVLFVLFLFNLEQSCLKKELISAQQDFVIKTKTKHVGSTFLLM